MGSKKWIYLLHLSENMWGDPGSTIRIVPYVPECRVDEKVWRDTLDFLPAQGFNTVLVDVGDAIQYESHPEISVKGAWSKDKLKNELDRMRSIGLTPLPKLNFSAGHDAWLGEYSRMLSTSIYYRVCADLIKEVAELFGTPELFHLGMDEEDANNQKGLSFCCVRQKDLFWHDMYYFFDICDKVGVRPWVWSDYCWHHPETFLEKMPKSVMQSNAYYNHIKKLPNGQYNVVPAQTYCTLEEHGYDQIPCLSFFEGYCLYASDSMQLIREEIAPERLKGIMTAPWRNTITINQYSLLDEAYRFGCAKKEFFPEEN